jgi:hypothetical protein
MTKAYNRLEPHVESEFVTLDASPHPACPQLLRRSVLRPQGLRSLGGVWHIYDLHAGVTALPEKGAHKGVRP